MLRTIPSPGRVAADPIAFCREIIAAGDLAEGRQLSREEAHLVVVAWYLLQITPQPHEFEAELRQLAADTRPPGLRAAARSLLCRWGERRTAEALPQLTLSRS